MLLDRIPRRPPAHTHDDRCLSARGIASRASPRADLRYRAPARADRRPGASTPATQGAKALPLGAPDRAGAEGIT
jgi:hypothetical protein